MTTSLSLYKEPAVLRRLRGGESPYGGQLCATDPPTVLVDIDAIPDEVWQLAPGGHLLTPLDVARTPDGHCAVFPHCAPWLLTSPPGGSGQDGRGGSPSAGQVVTIVVSVLRASAEARAAGISCGSWWIDGSGRPLLAVGGKDTWDTLATAVLRECAASCRAAMAKVIERAVRALADPLSDSEEHAAIEDELFALAEATPLCDTSQGRREKRARASHPQAVPRRVATLRDTSSPESPASWVAPHLDAGLVGRFATAYRAIVAAPAAWAERRGNHVAIRGEGPDPRTRRRAPVFVAAAVGATVVVGGLMWPGGSSHDTSKATPTTEALPTPSLARIDEAPRATPVVDAPSTVADTTEEVGNPLVDAASDVLASLRFCAEAQQQQCPAAMDDAEAPTPRGAVIDPRAQLTFIDEYGGVAVLRVDADAAPSQMLVLVKREQKWWARNVNDVAGPPES